jgi:hypothetical protein
MGIQKQRKARRNKIFEQIYDKVKLRINHFTKFCRTNCEYKVPYIIYGLPHVDLTVIADYIENRLRDEGFVTRRLTKISIYISWEESVIAEQAKINKEKRKLRRQQIDLEKLETERNNMMLRSLES